MKLTYVRALSKVTDKLHITNDQQSIIFINEQQCQVSSMLARQCCWLCIRMHSAVLLFFWSMRRNVTNSSIVLQVSSDGIISNFRIRVRQRSISSRFFSRLSNITMKLFHLVGHSFFKVVICWRAPEFATVLSEPCLHRRLLIFVLNRLNITFSSCSFANCS